MNGLLGYAYLFGQALQLCIGPMMQIPTFYDLHYWTRIIARVKIPNDHFTIGFHIGKYSLKDAYKHKILKVIEETCGPN